MNSLYNCRGPIVRAAGHTHITLALQVPLESLACVFLGDSSAARITSLFFSLLIRFTSCKRSLESVG